VTSDNFTNLVGALEVGGIGHYNGQAPLERGSIPMFNFYAFDSSHGTCMCIICVCVRGMCMIFALFFSV